MPQVNEFEEVSRRRYLEYKTATLCAARLETDQRVQVPYEAEMEGGRHKLVVTGAVRPLNSRRPENLFQLTRFVSAFLHDLGAGLEEQTGLVASRLALEDRLPW